MRLEQVSEPFRTFQDVSGGLCRSSQQTERLSWVERCVPRVLAGNRCLSSCGSWWPSDAALSCRSCQGPRLGGQTVVQEGGVSYHLSSCCPPVPRALTTSDKYQLWDIFENIPFGSVQNLEVYRSCSSGRRLCYRKDILTAYHLCWVDGSLDVWGKFLVAEVLHTFSWFTHNWWWLLQDRRLNCRWLKKL